jgi:NAD+ synthase
MNMEFNEAAFAAKAQQFLIEELGEAGMTKVVIGLSGGIDSAVAYVLAVRALGKENVIAVMLPNGACGTEACDYARLVASVFGAIPITRDIAPVVNLFAAMNGCEGAKRKGNLAARSRMVVLYDLAAENQALLLGTENKTEHYLGYFTIGGDEESDIELIRDLYKTQVRALASYLGVPQVIIDKPPTADLWEGQTDEGELGITYESADKAISALLECDMRLEAALDLGVPYHDAVTVVDRMKAISFKLTDTPYPTLATE